MKIGETWKQKSDGELVTITDFKIPINFIHGDVYICDDTVSFLYKDGVEVVDSRESFLKKFLKVYDENIL